MNKFICTLIASLVMSHSAMAADSVDHSGQASKHSVLASVEGVSTTAAVASAVVAAPVIVTGLSVVSAAEASHKSVKALHAKHVENTKPLTITTRVITRDPPPSEVVIEQTVNQ
ncbi:hypothetical protein [Alteromonas lipolytica]|uniref:Uncharacterized protein n=1 Tax=Alteromonas lipolytica TaxID=1856405 RepID=A0A1E8FDE7_9ALTE|nr:hypothetical protein [Alteromonas lipolytica]OFI33786.1 hypothetical protein BFC17_19640 [Alteromonas lipolytica]GGF68377.1 hypothetical protein GCM10011338_20750 [Alteromonas lipolytica]